MAELSCSPSPSPEIIIPPVLAIIIDCARSENVTFEEIICGEAGTFVLRCAVAWTAHKALELPFDAIGEALGGRHRTTARHLVERGCLFRKTDHRFVNLTGFLLARTRTRRSMLGDCSQGDQA